MLFNRARLSRSFVDRENCLCYNDLNKDIEILRKYARRQQTRFQERGIKQLCLVPYGCFFICTDGAKFYRYEIR